MTTLNVNSTAELITAVPYLIGFHPADSLAVVAVRGRQLAFAVRVDLPEPGADPQAARAAIMHLAMVVANQDVQAVTIIGYGDAERVTPAINRLSEAFQRAAIWVMDEARVTEGRYWSFETSPEGVACEPLGSVLAAEATFAGAVALSNREALEDQVAPVTGDDREAMIAATARAELRLANLAEQIPPGDEDQPEGEDAGPLPNERLFREALGRAGREAVREAERRYSIGGRLTDDEVAWLGLVLLDLEVRDYAWTRTGRREWEIVLWTDVARRVEPAYLPAPACLLAFVAWRVGWGSLANVAVDRVLAQHPEYTMAVIISDALMEGTRPDTLSCWPAPPEWLERELLAEH